MISHSGRYVLVFNGEIYNHLDLRSLIEKAYGNVDWAGHSDTETILAGFELWGVAPTLARCVGMFSFALWDKEEKSITLARDRLGEKPLYYGWQGNVFLFGSELKGLVAYPEFNSNIDRDALCLYLRHNYIPAPFSIYQGIKKLSPGCIIVIGQQNHEIKEVSYWSAAEIMARGYENNFSGNGIEAVNELDRLCRDSIRGQMMSDVPLGAFLSGGVDSSAVVALMQSLSSRPIKTFTIGFLDDGFNEANYAKAVAKHLGTDHTELYVTSQDAMNVIPQLPLIYDEPFSDSSQIPSYIVSKLARSKVTVSLSGDAGDELFCGYRRYNTASKIWNSISCVPVSLRSWVSKAILGFSPNTIDQFVKTIGGSQRFPNAGDKAHKGAGVLASRSSAELYKGLVSHFHDPQNIVLGSREPSTQLSVLPQILTKLDDISMMMALDLVTYLPDDILAKVDRAAMAVSLETRVPFLDHRIVEFAWSLPLNIKQKNGVGKWPLREMLYRYVPQSLIERPKMGFGIPLHGWLRGPLKEWASDLLNPIILQEQGIFDPKPIDLMWKEHLSGHKNWSYHLWDILMFQSWNANRK